MSKIAIREDGSVVYRGNMPDTFCINNKPITGLKHLVVPSDSAEAKGIFPLEEITPKFDSATHKIDGFLDDNQVDKTVQTWIVRAKTQEELDADAEIAATEYIRQRRAEYLPIPEQLDMIYWDKINGTTVWQDYVTDIKVRIPKP